MLTHSNRSRFPRAAGPLLLYFLVSLGLLWPCRSSAVRTDGDMKTVLALIIEARRALAEGQFPIRVAPDLQSGTRYPQFQYYGNFPFTVAGALAAICRDDPYLAWKLTTLASLMCGGYFTLRLAYALTRNYPASAMAGAVFLCAPYLLTDLYARVAFTELVGICLLPAAFYFSVRCFRSSHKRYVVCTAFAWALIALSHNITYLYGVLFAGLFFLSYLPLSRGRRRFGRLAVAGPLHGVLVLWYVLPQLTTINLLEIGSIVSPHFYAGLTPWRVLLSQTLANTPEGSETPNLGLQVGWPILISVLFCIAFALWRGQGTKRSRGLIGRVGLLWLLAFLIAWTPFDFWRLAPRTLWFVQFPYRMLAFATLWGALLSAQAIAGTFPRKLPGGVVVTFLAAIGFSTASFYPHGREPLYANLVQSLQANPNLGRLKEFVPKAEALTIENEDAHLPADVAFPPRTGRAGSQARSLRSSDIRRGPVSRCEFDSDKPALLAIPVLDYPGLLDVRVDGRHAPYGNSGRFVAVALSPGHHHLSVTFAGTGWANVVSSLGWGAVFLAAIVIGIRRLVRKRWKTLRCFRTSHSISPTAAVVGFAAMAVLATVPYATPVRQLFQRGPELSVSADHATWDGRPEYAFDDLPQTCWMAGTGQPTQLTVKFSRPARLHGVILEPRLVSLYEGWRRVRITLLDGAKAIWVHEFSFPNSGRERQQVMECPSIGATGIRFEFSEPVDELKDGSRIAPQNLSPGYSEIRLLWDR